MRNFTLLWVIQIFILSSFAFADVDQIITSPSDIQFRYDFQAHEMNILFEGKAVSRISGDDGRKWYTYLDEQKRVHFVDTKGDSTVMSRPSQFRARADEMFYALDSSNGYRLTLDGVIAPLSPCAGSPLVRLNLENSSQKEISNYVKFYFSKMTTMTIVFVEQSQYSGSSFVDSSFPVCPTTGPTADFACRVACDAK